jgi:DNA-binding beta-propeller fold protein YncE
MLFRRVLPLSLAFAIGGCSGTGSPGGESTADLKRVPTGARSYTEFESLQVRPLALSPDGRTLYAANTPDNRLEMFHIDGGGKLSSLGSVVVGLEPVAVAVRNANEVWVVNHLSDSISIVHIGGDGSGSVSRTLLVGDEPRDIVFGGADRSRAFITTAHRGQNSGDAYDLQTQGVGRADVWVFDANNLGSAAGGTRLTKLSFFADTPRALAVSADGRTVYAAAFNSGNQTTSVSSYAVATMYGGHMPGPATITIPGLGTIPQPATGLVVKFNGSHWVDAYGTVFDPFVKVKLPDLDVFAIDASGSVPVAKTNGAYAHVGTTLFNMAVNPRSGRVYVTNTEAHNDVRFEGHTPGFTSVVGHITDSRITVIDPTAGTVTPRDLNPHVDYTQAGNPAEKALSLAFPESVQVSSDGATLYTIAQGSQKLAIYKTADLEAGNVTPTLASQVLLSGGGPTGLAVDDGAQRAYVLTRFNNSISVVDLKKKSETSKIAMFNPEPASVTNGRKYLYDANLTSQHGTTACASCHIGGDKDELAWDLGNPGNIPLTITHSSSPADAATNVNIFTIAPALLSQIIPPFAPEFLFNMPLKGPMTTQSLRGMDNHGPMHWRGDRNGAINQDGSPVIDPATSAPVISAQPNAGIFDEQRAFTSFNVAFPGLIGDANMLSDADMNDFATFILNVSYPPNPVRNLDNSLTAQQQVGYGFFFNHVDTPNGPVELPSDRFHNCNGCHSLDANANKGVSPHPGFFGTDGRLSFEFETQVFKVPHLRNLYTKIGMFLSSPDTLQPGTLLLPEQLAPPSDQIRGFGFQHDGDLGQLEHFFTGQVFLQSTANVSTGGFNVGPNPYGIPFIDPNSINLPTGPVLQGDGGFTLRTAIVAFLMAFDSNFAPIVGQQTTLTSLDAATAGPRLDLLEARATAGECDLIAKGGTILGVETGFLFGSGRWQPSSMILPTVADHDLRALVQRGALPALTFTCVPPGSGVRAALDRDGDGYADGDELLVHTDPANPSSHP